MSEGYDPESEEMDKQEEKQSRLKLAEEQLLRESNAQNEKADGYFGQIWNAIVDNIQITIRNIHVRYQDITSCPDRPFGVGFTLHELSAVSTDADWKTDSFGVNTGIIYKLLKLGHFGIYCTTTSASFHSSDESQMIENFSQKVHIFTTSRHLIFYRLKSLKV